MVCLVSKTVSSRYMTQYILYYISYIIYSSEKQFQFHFKAGGWIHNIAFEQGPSLQPLSEWVGCLSRWPLKSWSDLYHLSSGGKLNHVLFQCVWNECLTTSCGRISYRSSTLGAGSDFSKHAFTRQMLPNIECDLKLSSRYSFGRKIHWKIR